MAMAALLHPARAAAFAAAPAASRRQHPRTARAFRLAGSYSGRQLRLAPPHLSPPTIPAHRHLRRAVSTEASNSSDITWNPASSLTSFSSSSYSTSSVSSREEEETTSSTSSSSSGAIVDYDVVVIGNGPIGSAVSRHVAYGGASVLVIDNGAQGRQLSHESHERLGAR